MENNQDIQKRLSDVQGKIKYLEMEKERNEKEKQGITEELGKLNIKTSEELEALIKKNEEELVNLDIKFNEALTKLEKSTDELVTQVKGA